MPASGSPSRIQQYLEELAATVKNPVHRRLLKAHQGDNPIHEMETELGRILNEVVERSED
ncbi:MAG: hypothetical protein HY666_00890 [Chloroflexi bacterium]|nr:hypothetical protein [Chloroflexota bacterium]